MFSEVKSVSVVTYKVKRAFSIEDSFNMINEVIFNQIRIFLNYALYFGIQPRLNFNSQY